MHNVRWSLKLPDSRNCSVSGGSAPDLHFEGFVSPADHLCSALGLRPGLPTPGPDLVIRPVNI